MGDLAEENERLCQIIRFLHTAPAPDPLTLRLARDELGEETSRLFCDVIGQERTTHG